MIQKDEFLIQLLTSDSKCVHKWISDANVNFDLKYFWVKITDPKSISDTKWVKNGFLMQM